MPLNKYKSADPPPALPRRDQGEKGPRGFQRVPEICLSPFPYKHGNTYKVVRTGGGPGRGGVVAPSNAVTVAWHAKRARNGFLPHLPHLPHFFFSHTHAPTGPRVCGLRAGLPRKSSVSFSLFFSQDPCAWATAWPKLRSVRQEARRPGDTE